MHACINAAIQTLLSIDSSDESTQQNIKNQQLEDKWENG